MRVTTQIIWKLIRIGGWLPLVVFFAHVCLSRVFHIYEIFPQADMPLHFWFPKAFKCFRMSMQKRAASPCLKLY